MKYYAYIKDGQTNKVKALMNVFADSEDEAMEKLSGISPAGTYDTLFLACIEDGGSAYAYWRDDTNALNCSGYYNSCGEWIMSTVPSEAVLMDIMDASINDIIDAGSVVSCSTAAMMLHVSKSRVSNLIANGQLETVEISGKKMVIKQSVLDRLKSNPTVGRPKNK